MPLMFIYDPPAWENHLPKAEWDKYIGSNHLRIPKQDMIMGGGIDFRLHLGHPLSQSLWNDLIHRMEVNNLWVIKHNQCEWTIGRMPGHCTIHLNEDETVKDIYYYPYPRID